MKFKLIILGFCLFFAGSAAFASSTYYLPQVAVGPFAQNGTNYEYRTSFVLYNNTGVTTNVTVNLFNNDGIPMTVNMTGVSAGGPVQGSSFTIGIAPGVNKILQASYGIITVGAAIVVADSDLGIGVSGMFTIYNVDNSTFVTEVGVQGLAAANLPNTFVLPVQQSANGAIATALALYNPYPWSATITMSLTNENNISMGDAAITLVPWQHAAFYVDQQFPSIQNSNFHGMLRVMSDGPLAAITLRQNAPSFFTYTSCPVVSTASSQTRFNLAQFADGAVGGGYYKTTIMLQNFRGTPTTIYFAARQQDGTTISPNLITTTGDYINNMIVIEGHGSRFLTSDGSTNAQGSMVITSNAPIGAAALFTLFSTDSSHVFQTEAGVQDSPSYTSVTLPIDFKVQNGGTVYGTGFALFNPNPTAVTLKPSFFDGDGLMSTAGTITLQPLSQQAMFFDSVFGGMGTVQGSLAFQGLTGTNGVSAMVLRMNMSPFNMTSFSAVSGTAAGFTGTSGTPRYTYMDITATMTSVNKVIPAAPTVTLNSGTGWNSATYVYKDVISQSSGRVFKPKTDNGTAFYLPPGNYTIRASGWVGTLGQWNGIWANYISDPTALSGNTTISVPAQVTTRTVTGSINNWSALKSSLGITTTAALSFYGTHISNSHYSFVVYCNTDTTGNGTFTQAFPDGTYTSAVLRQPISTGQVGIQNLTVSLPFTVDSQNTTVTLQAPNINTLSGSAGFAGGTPPTGAFTIKASDNSLPNFGYMNPLPGSYESGATITMNNPYYPGLSYFPRDTTWTQNPFGGSYSTQIGAGSNYKMSYSFTVYNSSNASMGLATYTPASGAAVQVDGDTSYNFDTLPALAPLVTVSGTITGFVGGTATVIARCDQVQGADGNIIPGLSYYAYGTANASGVYSLSVLPGLNYQLYYNTAGMQIYQ